MKKMIRLSIFLSSLLVLFGCRQNTGNKNNGEEKSFKIIFENPQFGAITAKRKNGSAFTSGQMAKENEELIFTVVPNKGYVVDTWKVARQNKDNHNEASLIVSEDVTVSVKLKGREYKVSYDVLGGHGTISAMQGSKPVNNNTNVAMGTVVFTATPDEGYKVKEWKLEGSTKGFDGNSGDITMTVEVKSDIDVIVVFELKKHTINFNVEGQGGSLQAKVGKSGVSSNTSVDYNSIVVFTAIPNDVQYEVDEWTFKGGEKVSGGKNGEKTLTLKAISDIIVKVSFKETSLGYTVSFAVDGDGGKIKAQLEGVAETEASPITNVPLGKKVTFTAIPDRGFRVNEWTGTAVEEGDPNTTASLEVTTNIDVMVSFVALALKWKIKDGVLIGYEGDPPTGDIKLPDNITEIAIDALIGCKNITKVICPATLKKIGTGAFANCTSVEEVVFPEDSAIEEVEANAFTKCTALKKFHIPKTLIAIRGNAFIGCTSLTEVTVDHEHPNYTAEGGIIYNKQKTNILFVTAGIITANIVGTVKRIPPSAFVDLKKLETVIVPSSCKEIGRYAFADCSALKTVTLPDELEDVGNYAFNNCVSLESILFGAKLITINQSAFQGCSKLANIIIKSTELEGISSLAFKGIKENARFKVRKGIGIKQLLLKCKSDIKEEQIEEVDNF
jgi:hypothetical protein